MINARAETLGEKPSFRVPLQRGRCLVPASGFYEWKKEGRRRVPWYIRVRDTPLFSFAGLYDRWRDPAGTETMTFAIITTEPNSLVAGLHNRMPAILPREKEETWIRAGVIGPAELTGILIPYPVGEMEAYPTSEKVNDPENEGPGLIQPLPGLIRPGTSLFPPGT
jgi:putative SOS response-associated peptidase YedK